MAKPRARWTDDLLTGDKEIDTHHRALFVMVERLTVACDLGRGAEVLDEILTFLQEYGLRHFEAEGKRMIALQYPYMETHRAAHRSYLNRLEDLTKRLANGDDKKAIAQATAEFTTDWFIHHVKLVDMPLIEYMRGSRPLKVEAKP